MNMKWVSRIHIGKVREKQEDALGVWPDTNPVLFVIADGLGGHSDGDIASQTAIQVVLEKASESNGFSQGVTLSKVVRICNQKIFTSNEGKSLANRMATTLTGLCFQKGDVLIAHVGDSRIYRVRSSKLRQLTQDHAVDDHTLTQAIGLEKNVTVDQRKLKIKKKDIYLLCSDGLYGLVSDSQTEQILNESGSLKKKADQLLQAALDAGGHDNISMILVEV